MFHPYGLWRLVGRRCALDSCAQLSSSKAFRDDDGNLILKYEGQGGLCLAPVLSVSLQHRGSSYTLSRCCVTVPPLPALNELLQY